MPSKIYIPSKTHLNDQVGDVNFIGSLIELEGMAHTTIHHTGRISYLKKLDFSNSLHVDEEIMPTGFFVVDENDSAQMWVE